jgi:Domain of unknown function (DUF5615)
MVSPVIAEQLGAAGQDVLAVIAHPVLRGIGDADLLDWATADGRTLVTDNVRDFAPLHASWAAQGRMHAGLIIISSKSYPQDRARTGRIVAALKGHASNGHWPAHGQYDFL